MVASEPKCSHCITVSELMTLHDTALLVSNSQDLVGSLEKALLILKSRLHLEKCAIHTLSDDLLRIYACVDFSKHQKELATYKLGEGATGFAAQSREPVVIENSHNDMMFLNKSGNRDKNSISYIAVPMLVDKKVIGVLGANITKTTAIDFESTIRLLTIMSSIFAQAIHSHNINLEQKERLEELKLYYKMEWDSKVHNFGDIIGDSPKMEQVFKVIQRIAQSDVTVLVRGETGTGKELVAAAIHKRSNRKDEPFIKLNCAAITDTLLESELFGHEKGAFTDARETRKGRFELADGGTLFLDEIGDI